MGVESGTSGCLVWTSSEVSDDLGAGSCTKNIVVANCLLGGMKERPFTGADGYCPKVS